MGQALLIIFNLFLLEAMLSLDNVSVLGLMVRDLPKAQQPHALRYGLWGAFILRGASLFFVSFLIKIIWLKAIGGIYLLYLCVTHFTPKKDSLEEGIDKSRNKRYLGMEKKIGRFWATVMLVEAMDMVFSIDNIFAATAMTDKVYLILIGVFAGMIAMRFVAQMFCYLLVRFPSLERSAFIVIGLLGIKLIGVSFIKGLPRSFDMIFSGCLMVVFSLPFLTTHKSEKHAIQ